jgi:hypothetical protein
MLKKLLVGLFVFLFLLAKPCYALDYQRAYEDYVYNLGLYRKAYAQYQLARSQFLESGTLKARESAQKATLTMLETRDEVMKTYLTALRTRLAESPGSQEDKEVIFADIDNEVSWYSSHKEVLSSAGSLDDLVDDSGEAQERFDQTQVIIYQTLATLSANKVEDFRGRLAKVISDLQGKISAIREKGDKKTDILERWLIDTQNRVFRSQEKQISAQTSIASLKTEEKKKLSIYNDAQFSLEEALQFLKEANGFLRQIIVEIKTAD